ncbi:MAG: hypothetical protein QN163_10665 [Armatimonadota bacterium]|nr:hypothetical protein [Armatimonadota bacterium]
MTTDGLRACSGFAVRSELEFHYLRHGGGVPLEIVGGARPGPDPHDELWIEWTPRPDNALHARLYSDGRTYRLWISEVGWYRVQPDVLRIEVPDTDEHLRREHRLWGLPTTLCAVGRGDLTLHAAAVEAHGGAIVLAGPSRFGKTTLAAAFHQAGFRLLSEDLTCIRPLPQPAAVPGPATLRIRRDVADRLALSGVCEVGRLDDRVCLAIDDARRGDCTPVPLRAVVFLRAGNGSPRLEPTTLRDGLADLWTLAFRLPNDPDRTRCFAGVAAVARTVSLWNFHRALRLEDLPAAVATLSALCHSDA